MNCDKIKDNDWMRSMNQERIGKFILELRKKNNLTQKELADKLGVTYQAVSKWENGKNIPDISILKIICEEYNIDINDLLDINRKKEKKLGLVLIIVGIIIITFILSILIYTNIKTDTFKFKTIESNCDNFNLSGSIAYTDTKSAIYISNVEYCGKKDDTKYKKIECTLYEVNGDSLVKVGMCGYDINTPMTLNDYLSNIKISIDNYNSICKEYSDNNLQIQISATDENEKIISYIIPLKLNDNDNKNIQN